MKLRYSKRIAKSTGVSERLGSLYVRICIHAVSACKCKREKCSNYDLEYVHVSAGRQCRGAVSDFCSRDVFIELIRKRCKSVVHNSMVMNEVYELVFAITVCLRFKESATQL